MQQKLQQIVEKVFKTYDVNNSGTLESKQIEKFLNDAYAQVGRKPSNFSEANDLIKNYDKNKDGVIDKKEFRQVLRKMLNIQ